ncbi:MAG TPA: diguanylate cyclase [Xanthobacteraceae bacterium]|nr:diguanylate cyclase [Xanthobacteraceae bacterium]
MAAEMFVAVGSAALAACAICLIVSTRRRLAHLEAACVSLRRQNDELRAQSDALLSGKTNLASLTRELETTLETMDQGLMTVDARGIVVQCNSRARRLLGLPDDMMAARPRFVDVLNYQWHTNQSGREDGSFAAFAARRLVADRAYAHELRRPDGRIVEVRSIPLATGGFVRTYTDITARKVAEEQVRYLARHDDLTRLINRATFRERLGEALSLARQSGRGVAVMYLDLDHFKDVNDSRGHDVGDRVLADAARRMRMAVRATDTVARLGGDEFAVILSFLDNEKTADDIGARLVAAIAEPYAIDAMPARIGVSIGIALYPQDGGAADELLQQADRALYAAKRAGRGTYRFQAAGPPRVTAARN